MKSVFKAATVAAFAGAAAAQNACGAFNCPNNVAPTNPIAGVSLCTNTAGFTIATPLQALTNVASAQACAQACQQNPQCTSAIYLGLLDTCTLGSTPLLTTDITALVSVAAVQETDFIAIVPACAASSSSASGSSSGASSASSAGNTAATSASASATGGNTAVTSASAPAGSSSGAVSGTVSLPVTSAAGTGTSSAASSASSAAATSFPICPQDNLKVFTANAANGQSSFSIVCGAGTVGRRSLGGYPAPIAKRQIPGAPLNAFGICITACANIATCQSVLFNPINGACALFDCIVTVPAGLSGAVRITSPGGFPFVGTPCPSRTPLTIPAPASNATTINFNLNLNIDIDIEVNVLAGEYEGVPYTQICRLSKCKPCEVCKKKPVNECSVCEKKGKDSPLKPSKEYCPPGEPGKPGFPGTCKDCYKHEPQKPVYPADDKDKYYPAKPAGDDKYKPVQVDDDSDKKGKYTGPYSNDAAGLSAVSGLVAGIAAVAFAL